MNLDGLSTKQLYDMYTVALCSDLPAATKLDWLDLLSDALYKRSLETQDEDDEIL